MPTRTGEELDEPTALHREVESLRSQQVKLDRELIRRAFRIDELERNLARVETEYRSSLSWRITAPIRRLKSLVATLLRR